MPDRALTSFFRHTDPKTIGLGPIGGKRAGLRDRAFLLEAGYTPRAFPVRDVAMPSFDVVSQVDLHELTNAVDQANREIANRFDFKGTDSRIERSGLLLTLEGSNEFQLKQMRDILCSKLVKRGVDIGSLEEGKVQESGSRARQDLTVRQGIDKDTARKMVKLVKESKLKVQAAVQGEQIRVTGKKRDELQRVIALLREASFELPLQYLNFRD